MSFRKAKIQDFRLTINFGLKMRLLRWCGHEKKDTSEEMSCLVDQTLRIIGITPKAVEKHLAKLKAEGIIKRDGPDKGGSWTVL